MKHESGFSLKREARLRTVRRFAGVGALVVAAALAGCAASGPPEHMQQQDSGMIEKEPSPHAIELLRSGTWNYHPGVTMTETGATVRYIGRQIVEQDGSNPVDNPPVNLYGTRLDVEGDFAISTTISQLSGEAAITLYGRPPIILDEARVEAPSVRIALEDDLWVGLYDGTTNVLAEEARFDDFTSGESTQLTVSRHGDRVRLAIDGKTLGDIADHGIFDGGQVWFGLEAGTSDGSWVLSDLSVEGIDGGNVSRVDTTQLSTFSAPADSLRTLANSRLRIGAAVSLEPLVSDPTYRELAAGQFSSWTTENALKMQFTQPQRGVYDFSAADAIFDLAQKHAIDMHMHTLVFGEANPVWVQRLAESDPAQLRAVMLDRIETTLGRYKGRVRTVDVVNEPLADYDQFVPGRSELRHHIWHQAMGEEYIELALRKAHEVDPGAQLLINEYGLEGSIGDGGDTDRWDAFLALIDRLRAKGVPLHGVGFQSHVYEAGDEVDAGVFRSRIEQLRQRGLRFRVSELDVHNDNGRVAQARQVADMTQICMEYANNCLGVTTWGVTDAYGSTGYIDNSGVFRPGEGLLFDVRQQPTPAVRMLQDILSR